MANPEHLRIFVQGVKAWNQWRRDNPTIRPDLSDANLFEPNLPDANLSVADLFKLKHNRVIINANFTRVNLGRAILSKAFMISPQFDGANLSGTNFARAQILAANFSGAILNEADFNKAKIGAAIFADNDLSAVRGLETVQHVGPSFISIDTIYRSGANISKAFLRGCGVPDDFITYMHSLTAQPIQFYSCFISYSHEDEDFARRLFSRMREANLRVWYAPEEMKGGDKLYDQIDRAIQLHDRLLLVLSEESIKSEWVLTEIRRARRAEINEKRRKLFPIRLVDFETIRDWSCFDADTGKDLAVELREYFIPDFSNWKDHDSFEKAFNRLLRDLKAEENVVDAPLQTKEGKTLNLKSNYCPKCNLNYPLDMKFCLEDGTPLVSDSYRPDADTVE